MWRCCVAQVEFLSSPSGTVYIPPIGSPIKTVRCTTNATADITWVQSEFGKIDPTRFNITQENSTSSIMLVHQSFVDTNPLAAGYLTRGTIVCRSGTTDSGSFTFRQGGKCCMYFNVCMGSRYNFCCSITN